MGLFNELKKLAKPYSEEDEFDEEEYEEQPRKRRSGSTASADDELTDYASSSASAFDFSSGNSSRTASTASASRGAYSMASDGKVVNISATTVLQVVLSKPTRFAEVSDIADHLREKRAVVLNLESTNKDVARRLVDFLSGCAYALDGKIRKVAVSTYLITPYNVDFTGDLIDELENNSLYL